jgi:NADH-quinone oxidoreductase subunit F
MDLRLMLVEVSPEEREAIDLVLGPEPADDGRAVRGGHARRAQRHLLLPALRAVQRRVGWIGQEALDEICRRLTVPPAEAYGVASFYALLALEPRPERVTHVCTDLVCRLAGAPEPEGGHSVATNCLGLCDHAPAALLTVAGPEPEERPLSLAGQIGPANVYGERRLTRRIGVVDPTSLASYREHGGFETLEQARHLGASAVIDFVTEAGLLGRGGAAFPTGTKWAAAAGELEPRYLVCNADESEPGTFKDRMLMEEDPFAVVEAVALAAFAAGCERAYLYVRGEYPLAHERLTRAIESTAELTGVELELRIGAGAYICGEETALFESLEGRRGEPRNKPPFPTQAGLFGRPTVVNNVETLLNALDIVREGPEAWRAGETRLFCVSGNVERPGVYEVRVGTPLPEILDLAGAEPPQAVLLGGAAGSFLRPDELGVELSFEGARAAGATLGSGAVIVFGPDADLGDAVLRIAEFFRDESCGQCVPCRVGTVRQEEALHRLAAGKPLGSRGQELTLLTEMGQAMTDASICGLGQTASAAVLSALEKGLVWSS